MNVLIVFAHPEQQSFSAALKERAVKTLSTAGHEVEVSDLYAMQWNSVLGAGDFANSRANPDYLDPSLEQEQAFLNQTYLEEVMKEQVKVARADLVLFHFPVWWFSMPAILKGWVDRVFARGFAYSTGKKYESGHFAGKRAMLCLTTGTASTLYEPNGIDGDLHHVLWPIHNGILAYTGFTVLPPYAAWMPARVSEAERAGYLDGYARHLNALDELEPLYFHPWRDYDDTQRLKPGVIARSGVQWNPVGGLDRQETAQAFTPARRVSEGTVLSISREAEKVMKGYWLIMATEVIDVAAQQEYSRLWQPISQQYQARLRVLDEDLVESCSRRRVMVMEFPSYAVAKACYDDPAYVHARTFANRAAHRELIIVEGDLG